MTPQPEPSSADSATVVALMVGRWEGTGVLEYPTIETSTYRELLTVERLDERWPLHYVQRTWRPVDEFEAPSHVETGFISIAGSEDVEILNAQGPDRVEILRGQLLPGPGTRWTLDLQSVALAGDVRMRTSSRSISFDGRQIEYTMVMSTDRVERPTLHLTARLERVEEQS